MKRPITAAALIVALVALGGCASLAPWVQNVGKHLEEALWEKLKNRIGQIDLVVTDQVNEEASEAIAAVQNIQHGVVASTAREKEFAETVKSETLVLSAYHVAWVVNDRRRGDQLFVCDVRLVAYCGQMRAGDRYDLEAADIHPDRVCLSTPAAPDPRRCFESWYNVRKIHPPRGKR